MAKDRIAELYMNLAHWGPGVYGVKQAARYYFNKRPSKLGIREAIFLASILPSPVRFGGHYAEGYIRADRLTKMRNVLLALYRKGVVTHEGYVYHLHRINRAQVSKMRRPTPPSQDGEGVSAAASVVTASL